MAREKVTVFLGNFDNEEELQSYTEFVYDDEGDATSQLCKQTGIEWFDEDFTEAFMFDREQPFEQIMMASYADTFEPALQKHLIPTVLKDYNAIILLYNVNYNKPAKSTAKVSWAGVFDYTVD